MNMNLTYLFQSRPLQLSAAGFFCVNKTMVEENLRIQIFVDDPIHMLLQVPASIFAFGIKIYTCPSKNRA